MTLIYSGKTKEVHEIDKDHVLLKFKDDMTGKDGVFDPGENQIGLTVEGMGRTNLRVTERLYKVLQGHGIKTHMVSANLDKGEMVALRCQPFGHGLEVIYRNFATGSFIRRYGAYIKEMTPLHDYVEMTLKDDKRQDPLITKEGLIALNILTSEEYETLAAQTIKIARILTEFIQSKGMELIDIKFEFGKMLDGEIILMDEISSGSMRVYRDGQKLDPDQISQGILS